MKQVRRTAGRQAQTPFSPHPLTLETARAFARQTVAGAVFVAAGLSVPGSLAAPQDANVVAGQATVQQSGSTTTVTQGSQRAAIDWRSFSVGATESVNFVQPSANSATLNRVTGADPSAIFGRITANGQVLLINPNGIVFGRTAQVDVGGLVASTTNISNANFMAGKMEFTEPGKPGATVENHGSITVGEGGFAALVGRGVNNSGVINARLGKVSLAAGDAFVLDLYGDQLVNLVVDPAAMASMTDAAGTPLAARVDHSGSITADGGRVQLTAATVKRLVDNVINVSGVVRATSFETAPGRISLKGDANTSVVVSGSLETSGHTGGRIEVTGHDVTLASAANLDATGRAGGGSVSVGGDWQGKGPLLNAMQVSIETGARIDASVTGQGNGGTVAIWSDDRTRFEGNIAARGGAQGGAGGNVEVSSKGQLGFLGDVDVFAANGNQGSVLLDPANLRIGTVSSGDSEISAEQIRFLLTRGASVTLTADQNVTVDAEVNGLAAGGVARGGLTLTAGNNLTVNRNIVLNDGALNLTATNGALSSGPGTVLYGGNGAVTLRGGAGVSVDRVLTSGAVDIASSAGAVSLGSAVVAPSSSTAAPAASLTIRAQQGITLNGALTSGNIDVRSTAGDVSLRSASLESQAGSVFLQAGGAIGSTGAGVGLLATGTAVATNPTAGNVSATAGGALDLQAAIASGELALTAGSTINAAQTLGNANGIASRRITVDGTGNVTLAGANAGSGGLSVTSRNGSISSNGAGGGLVSSSAVNITALGGTAGTTAAPLGISAGDGAGAAGATGGARIEGRDGVALAAMVTPGAVLLRSANGGVHVASAIAGSAGTTLATAAPTREVRVQAAGDVALAGARAGSGGVTVLGATTGGNAGSFSLVGGSIISDGDVNVNTTGAISTGALVQSAGRVQLTATTGTLTVGEAGISATGAGRGIGLTSGGNLAFNGDLVANAATVQVSSTGGAVTARVVSAGESSPGDAVIDAGTDANASVVIVSAKDDATLSGVRAHSSVSATSSGGNVLLLSPLGGDTTGYQNYDNGYQSSLRPQVGTLTVAALSGSVELNGLNLDGIADPRGTGNGLSVTAARQILSNGKIAVNKGNIVLQAGTTQATDGVYLGNSLFSRGWDSVGTDGVRGGTGPNADEKIAYGIRITGRNLGLFDNTDQSAALPGLYRVLLTDAPTLAGRTAVFTDLQGYVVDPSTGLRRDPALRVNLDESTSNVTMVSVDSAGAISGSGGTQPTTVLGVPISRNIASIEIANNSANYGANAVASVDATADQLRSRLVPNTSTALSPTVNLDVSTISGLSGDGPSSDGLNVGRIALQGLQTLSLAAPSMARVFAASSTANLGSSMGVALKVLTFDGPSDTSTVIWGSSIDPRLVSSDLTQLSPSGSGNDGAARLFETVDATRLEVTVPYRGLFTLTTPTVDRTNGEIAYVQRTYIDSSGNVVREPKIPVPGGVIATLRQLPGQLSGFAQVVDVQLTNPTSANIEIANQPSAPPGSTSVHWSIGLGGMSRLENFSPALQTGTNVSLRINSLLLGSGGVAQAFITQGGLFSQNTPAPTSISGAGGFSPVGPTITNQQNYFDQRADGSIDRRNSGVATLPTGGYAVPSYTLSRVVVDSSSNGRYSAGESGTRVLIFDGALDSQAGRALSDNAGAPFVPGFSGTTGSRNDSTTTFASVGGAVGSPTGGSSSASTGATSTQGVSGTPGASEVPTAPTSGIGNRVGQDPQLSLASGTESDRPDADNSSVEIGQRPSAQADLGRGGSVPAAAPNTFKRVYRVATTRDGLVCAPDAIAPTSTAPNTTVTRAGETGSTEGPGRECK